MSRHLLITLLLLASSFAICTHSAIAQSVYYTHTSGPTGDGFLWDQSPTGGLNDLDDGEVFYTPDINMAYANYSGNTTYFDNNYQAAGNSSVIDGDAWWGNPTVDGYSLEFEFDPFVSGPATTFSFDFAWANAGRDAQSYLGIQVFDYEGDGSSSYEAYTYLDLNEVFNAGSAFGGFEGRAGHAEIDVTQLFDIYTDAPFGQIDYMILEIYEPTDPSFPLEFAIDNVEVNQAGTSDNNSEVAPSSLAISSNFLRGTNPFSIGFDVQNTSLVDTTFSASIEPTSSPEFQAADPLPTGVDAPAGSSVYTGYIATLPADTLSGEYLLETRISNDLNSSDPDEVVPYTLSVFDPVELSGNNSSTIQVDTSPGLSLANAAVESHTGALRATAEVIAVTASDGFGLVGLPPTVGDTTGTLIAPGSSQAAEVTFDHLGKRSATYAGTVSVEVEMTTPAGYLNYANEQPMVSWEVAYTLADTTTDSASLSQNGSYAGSVGINSAKSATTIVAGSSPVGQTLGIDQAPNTGTNATLLSDAAELDFSGTSGLYVLQITYDPATLGELSPMDLAILELDTTGTLWQLAIEQNTDGGVGGTAAFSGTFEDYLTSDGNGVLDSADLSQFGFDTTNHTAWAVLDHEGTFALGSFESLPGDYNADGVVNLADYTLWRDHLGSNFVLPNDPIGGIIGSAQYDTWKANFGQSIGAGTAATLATVPEPSTACLLAILMAAAVSRLPRQPLVAARA
ncbi:hypothetical protein [Aeoliella mucimassa]|uniref:PEP-CTERM protein-sorting domain-containing protein n=1 Tax=Aeoliella mucimassa TaxID=2527972 RepID=A0A518AK65_9BACT|nr:hypothetical protein [Aeoliella mucimassa]QDU55127.1 hypothetical protein Pan181_13130 [Aeoliella mucimassa]